MLLQRGAAADTIMGECWLRRITKFIEIFARRSAIFAVVKLLHERFDFSFAKPQIIKLTNLVFFFELLPRYFKLTSKFRVTFTESYAVLFKR